MDEPEILDGRLAFTDAQAALHDEPIETRDGFFGCGWYGSAISRERGSFALVNRDGPLADLVGDRVRLTADDNSVVVYVLATEVLDYDIHITRRAYAGLSLLAVDRTDVVVEVLSA